MSVFRNAVFLAAVAGALAGIILGVVQLATTVPLILQAEVYEQQGETAGHDHTATAEAAAPSHEHEDEGWAPADGFERTAFTIAASIVTGIGFALIFVAASELAGGIAGWRQGVLWGFAGFAVFTLAPGLGLPPELSAMPAAELLPRQIWWIGTVAATAAGLALIAFRRETLFALLGVALLVAPHLIGAPQPVSYETPIPEGLHHQFVVAVTVSNLVFWLALGAIAGLVRDRWFGDVTLPRERFA